MAIHPDAFWTPHEASSDLLARHYLPEPVWEPACGAGGICRALDEWGYEFVATDLHRYGYPKQHGRNRDFLTEPSPGPFRTICTNPPFTKDLPGEPENPIRDFLRRSCRHYKPDTVAMFLPLGAGMIDVTDGSLTGDMGLRLVVYNKKRPKFHHADGREPEQPRWPCAWFVLERGWWRAAELKILTD